MSDTQYQAGILAGLTPGALPLCSLCVGNTHVEANTAFDNSNPAFAYLATRYYRYSSHLEYKTYRAC